MMPFFRFSSCLGLCAFSVLSLSGCQHFLGLPSPMPSGYKYHNDLYKSPPSPEADDIGYTFSAAENENVMTIWQSKAREVLQAFKENAGMDLKAVYIDPPSIESAQNSSFDFALREELRAQGVILASSPYDVVTLSFEIMPVPDKDAPPPYPRAERIGNDPQAKIMPDYEAMIITLSVTDGPQVLASSSNVHIVPMFGYRHDYKNGLKFFDSIAGGYTPKKTLD